MGHFDYAILTGPTGVLGTALIRRLVLEGISVTAVVKPGSSRVDQIPRCDSVRVVECDLQDYGRLASLVADVEGRGVFFHLAWASTFGADARNDMPTQILNIKYAIDAVRAAHELGCCVFVGAGSQSEYGRVECALRPDMPVFPENGYGMAKLCAGQMTRVECEKYGLRHEWIRVLSLYGPNDNPDSLIISLVKALMNGSRPSLTLGEQMWDYLYADDAAEAFLLAAIKGVASAVYCLGSGEARPLREYIEATRDAVNPSLPLGFGDIPYSDKQVMFLCADIDSLVHDTGFRPKIPFELGIARTIEWYKAAALDENN